MSAYARTSYLYEHLQDTEPAQHLDIDEVIAGIFVVDLDATNKSVKEHQCKHGISLTCSAGDAAGEEVAELKNVWSLEVCGKLDLSQLTPGATYEVAFEVMLKQGCAGWQVPVDLQLELPGARAQERKESLEKKARGQWLPLKVGDVEVEKGQQGGELVVSMSQDGGHWKSGLVVRGIRIAPKN